MKQKKNKTNQVVTWPTATLFTIAELHRLNPKFILITLRVRLTKAIEAGKVVEIGSIPGESGRPPKVFSLTPVTQNTLNKARAEDVTLVDNADKLIRIITVTNPISSSPVNPVSTTLVLVPVPA